MEWSCGEWIPELWYDYPTALEVIYLGLGLGLEVGRGSSDGDFLAGAGLISWLGRGAGWRSIPAVLLAGCALL